MEGKGEPNCMAGGAENDGTGAVGFGPGCAIGAGGAVENRNGLAAPACEAGALIVAGTAPNVNVEVPVLSSGTGAGLAGAGGSTIPLVFTAND